MTTDQSFYQMVDRFFVSIADGELHQVFDARAGKTFKKGKAGS
jgi:hypothetical protein